MRNNGERNKNRVSKQRVNDKKCEKLKEESENNRGIRRKEQTGEEATDITEMDE